MIADYGALAATTESFGEEMFDFDTARFNGRWSAMGVASFSGFRDSSLHTVAQDFAFRLSLLRFSAKGG